MACGIWCQSVASCRLCAEFDLHMYGMVANWIGIWGVLDARSMSKALCFVPLTVSKQVLWCVWGNYPLGGRSAADTVGVLGLK